MQMLNNWFKKYFIPHKDNDHKPHLLRHESMLGFLFLIIIFEVGFLVQVFVVFDKTSFLAAVLPGVLTSITNDDRAKENLPPLVQNELLNKAAQLKAEDMASRGYFAHTSPEGKTPWYWFGQVGYKFTKAGENLAVNFFESVDVAEAWMNSPTHRANIVKKEYTEIGIGVASGTYQGKDSVFVVQLFATPVPAYVVPKQPAKPTPTSTIPTKVVSNPPTTQTNTIVLGEETNTSVVVEKNSTTLSNLKSFIQRALTSPREYLSYLYGGIGLLMIFALFIVIFKKSEIKHSSVLLRGATVLSIIVLLSFINTKVLKLETNIETSDTTANVIDIVAY